MSEVCGGVGGLEKKAFLFGATPEGYCSHKCFFFLWSTYGTHRELFGRKGLNLVSHIQLYSNQTHTHTHKELCKVHTEEVKDKIWKHATGSNVLCTLMWVDIIRTPFQAVIKLAVGYQANV